MDRGDERLPEVMNSVSNPRHGSTHLPSGRAGAAHGGWGATDPSVPLTAAGVAWTQWGGPHRNFTTEASGIKDTWPAAGPRVVWKRKLGEGYSSPAVEGGVLYSMYGRRGEEVVLRRQRRHRPDPVGARDADDVRQRRRARDGQRSVLHAVDRRRSRIYNRRGRAAAMFRQEIRQAALDAAAVDRTSRLAADVRLRVEPDRLSRHRCRAGRRPRQSGDGLPAGRRQGGMERATTSATSIRRRC